MAENLATFRAAGQCHELIRGANLPPARAWFLSTNPRESGSYPGWIGVDCFVGKPVTGRAFRATERQKPTQRSGTDPDDRGRNRDAQAKGADNCQDEFGKQIWLGSHIR